MPLPLPTLARWLPLLLASLALSLPGRALAEERLDHRNQFSLWATPVAEYLLVTGAGERRSSSVGPLLELGAGVPLTDEGGEGLFSVRGGAGPLDPAVARLSALASYRGFFGDEEWKTAFDAGAFVRVLPDVAPGLRLGAGLQRELSEHLGLYSGLGCGVALAGTVQLSVELQVGLQWRPGPAG